MSIRVLPDEVINRIAAGEVVERPASAVKELLENALDAGARDLRLDAGEGGRSFLRVSDDGSGMARQDALLCIERHATSKIRSDEDLARIGTLGFRGEALPSIASVSRFELRTRSRDAEEGTRIRVEGGRLLSVEACGCPPGTEVTVRDLFFNVRPRRAFLKSTRTEWAHCLETLVRLALVRPDVDFSVTHDEREVLRAPRAADLRDRAQAVLGPFAHALRPVAFKADPIGVRGLISPVGVHRENQASSVYFYVNGRFVRDAALRRALAAAYQGLVPVGRSPIAVLDLELDPSLVDVNVHPTKIEVRFRDAWLVEKALSTGIRDALRDFGLHQPSRPSLPRPAPTVSELSERQGVLPLRSGVPREVPWSPPEPAPVVHDAATPYVPPPLVEPLPSAAPAPAPVAARPAALPEPPRDEGRLLPTATFADLRVIGQYADTYVLCEGGGELVLIDQHAAHERVMLERLGRLLRSEGISTQVLLVPQILELSPARAAVLEDQLHLLARIGFDVAFYGGASFAVRGVPAGLRGLDPLRLAEDLADDLIEGGRGATVEALDRIALSRLACHSAIRAHQALSLYEMRSLLGELDRVDFGVCAHGRPVAVRVSAREIEARFHRT